MKTKWCTALLCALCLLLAACEGAGEAPREDGETGGLTALPVALTDEELRDFEAMFRGGDGETRSLATMLLCCDYVRPEEADLGLIFREGIPDAAGGWGYHATDGEKDALAAALGVGKDDFLYWGDTYRMPRAEMEALTRRWLGIGLSEGRGLEQLTYLAQYDAYFTTVTDTMAIVPTLTAGMREGDTVRLRYRGPLDGEKELTLRQSGEDWRFCANLPAAE